jgi:hypothetical protein
MDYVAAYREIAAIAAAVADFGFNDLTIKAHAAAVAAGGIPLDEPDELDAVVIVRARREVDSCLRRCHRRVLAA